MATTISSNYYAIDTARAEAAESVFNIELGDNAKHNGARIEIAIVESVGDVTINLPSVAELKGIPTPIVIRDAGGFIADGTAIVVAPYTDEESDYTDFIQATGSEPTTLAEAGSGIQVSWSAAIPSDGVTQEYWNATSLKQ